MLYEDQSWRRGGSAAQSLFFVFLFKRGNRYFRDDVLGCADDRTARAVTLARGPLYSAHTEANSASHGSRRRTVDAAGNSPEISTSGGLRGF